MQKKIIILYIHKIGLVEAFVKIMIGCQQRGPLNFEIHQTFKFSLLVDFLRILKIKTFETDLKINP